MRHLLLLALILFISCETNTQSAEEETMAEETMEEEVEITLQNAQGLEIVDVEPIKYLGVEADIPKSEMGQLGTTINQLYGKVMTSVESQYAPDERVPMSVYQSFSDPIELVIAMELPDRDQELNLEETVNQQGTTDGGKAVKAVHKGSYKNLMEAHNKIRKVLEENNLEIIGYPYEIYRTSSQQESDTLKWVTEVYYPVDSNP